MKRILLCSILLSSLMACGGSGLSSSIEPQASERLPTTTEIVAAPSPHASGYEPTIHGMVVELDTMVASTQAQVALTMRQDQVLHLTSSAGDVPTFEWFIDSAPGLFAAAIDDQSYTLVQSFTAYPPRGVVLTPLLQGTYPLTIHLRFAPCATCTAVARETVYTVTIE